MSNFQCLGTFQLVRPAVSSYPRLQQIRRVFWPNRRDRQSSELPYQLGAHRQFWRLGLFSCCHSNTFRVFKSTPRVDTFCVQSLVMKTIGERIQQARLAKCWSAEYLSKKVGYKTQSGISNLENKATGSGGNKISEIAFALDVTVDWLLNGPDSDNVPFMLRKNDQRAAAQMVQDVAGVYVMPQPKHDPLTLELLDLFSQLDTTSKVQVMEYFRGFVAGRRPHAHGQASAVAG
jgi:transcriptional regulator with XRE-family HTH domain